MTPESALMRQITDYLTIKGIWHMRIQPFNGKTESGHWMRSARKGCADLLCTLAEYTVHPATFKKVMRPRPLWLELKSAKGKQTTAQYEFQAEVEAHGHYYLIVRDFTDLERWLNERR